jgi:hypothetical protein
MAAPAAIRNQVQKYRTASSRDRKAVRRRVTGGVTTAHSPEWEVHGGRMARDQKQPACMAGGPWGPAQQASDPDQVDRKVREAMVRARVTGRSAMKVCRGRVPDQPPDVAREWVKCLMK